MNTVSLPMLEDRRSYVYAHAKATTGEIFYIGKGIGRRAHNLKTRSDWHKRVVEKHGVDVHILERNLTAGEAYVREVVLIQEGREIGLELVNMTDGGTGALNPNAETRAKISAALRKREYTPERRAQMSKAASNRTPETLAKMSASQKGRVFSGETRAKMSAAMSGRKGHIPSAETRAKRSATLKGRVFSDETLAKMSASHKGKTLSAEHRLKLSVAGKAAITPELRAKKADAFRGGKHTDEAKLKMSAAAKSRSPELLARIAEARRAAFARKATALKENT